MADFGTDIKELTDNGLAEAAGLISRREYNLSIVRSRQTAEMLVKAYAAENNIEYTTLADTIEKLFQEGIINRTSRDAFHNIRLYGNKAVHEKDDDPEDAQKAYYLLKNEVRTFNSRKTVSVDRTPVRIDPVQSGRSAGASGQSGEGRAAGAGSGADAAGARRRGSSAGRSAGSSSGRSGSRDKQEGAAGSRRGGRSSAASGASSSRRGGRQAQERESSGSGISIYDILKILIPVVAVILLIIIIRSLIPSKKNTETTTAAAAVETSIEAAQTEVESTEAPTTEAPTEAPPSSTEYRIKGSMVNIRYADNQNRIYTQLPNGTVIGKVTEIEGSDFVQFTLDGQNVVVNKNYIEPVS